MSVVSSSLTPGADRLEADVVDAAAHHEAERLEADLLHEQELVHREIAREEVVLPHAREALARVLREIGGEAGWGAGRWLRRLLHRGASVPLVVRAIACQRTRRALAAVSATFVWSLPGERASTHAARAFELRLAREGLR